MTKITLAGTQPNDPILTNIFMYQSSNPHKHLWANERVSVNDCFLRNMQKYKYIANIDNDEVIVPQGVSTWSKMIKLVKKKTQKKVKLDPGLFSKLILCVYFKYVLLGFGWFMGIQDGVFSRYHAYHRK